MYIDFNPNVDGGILSFMPALPNAIKYHLLWTTVLIITILVRYQSYFKICSSHNDKCQKAWEPVFNPMLLWNIYVVSCLLYRQYQILFPVMNYHSDIYNIYNIILLTLHFVDYPTINVKNHEVNHDNQIIFLVSCLHYCKHQIFMNISSISLPEW